MNILVIKKPKGTKNIAQLWIIRKIKYIILVVNQFLSYKVKLCSKGNNCNNLYFMLKRWGNLRKNFDLIILELVINVLTRPDKIEELIHLIMYNKKTWNVIKTIYFQDIFLFIYDV